jgi:hypothetical protein
MPMCRRTDFLRCGITVYFYRVSPRRHWTKTVIRDEAAFCPRFRLPRRMFAGSVIAAAPVTPTPTLAAELFLKILKANVAILLNNAVWSIS